MQETLETVSETPIDMPPTDSQFSKLEKRVKGLEDRGPEQAPALIQYTTQPQKLSSFALILAIVGGLMGIASFVAGGVWVVHLELSRIDQAIGKTDKRMVGLTMAIKVLGDAQGGKTKDLVDDALTIAKAKNESGDTQAAARTLAIANELIAEQKQKGVQAPHQFFRDAVANYSEIWEQSHGYGAAADQAFMGTLQLAEYRSALTLTPQDFHPKSQINPVNSGAYIGHMQFENGYILLTDSILVGLKNFKIDHYMMENVVFSGATVIYDGGPLVMRNVTFVNCKFLVRASVLSNQFLRLEALGETSAKIPS
jgi:hypothetical protein